MTGSSSRRPDLAEALGAARDWRDDACAAFVALRESEEMSGVGEAAWVV